MFCFCHILLSQEITGNIIANLLKCYLLHNKKIEIIPNKQKSLRKYVIVFHFSQDVNRKRMR